MIILDWQKKNQTKIIGLCAEALRAGKTVVYPTDTCYGLAVDATNVKAIKELYRLKGRNFRKPVHIIPPSIAAAKKIVVWNKAVSRLAKRFFPGPITLVLPLTLPSPFRQRRTGRERGRGEGTKMLSAGTGFLGIRMPKNKIALDLAKVLNRPITTTSANVSGQADNYSTEKIIRQFKNQKFRPDLIIDAGRLAKRRPSTVVKLDGKNIQILREGPVSEIQINKVLK